VSTIVAWPSFKALNIPSSVPWPQASSAVQQAREAGEFYRIVVRQSKARYRRFARTLAGACARLRAEAVRYSFTVVDFHHLLLAGFTGAPMPGSPTTPGSFGALAIDAPLRFAFCMPRRHRHPGLHRLRRSIPRLYAPLSTLRRHPRGYLRMTRGRCGSLVLHRNGLAPSTSCRPSRRTAARWLAYAPPCQRFAETLAGNCA